MANPNVHYSFIIYSIINSAKFLGLIAQIVHKVYHLLQFFLKVLILAI